MEPFNKLQNLFNKRNMIIIIIIMMLLTVVSIETIFNKEIVIRDEEQEVIIQTLSSKVDYVLNKAGITLNEHDKLNIDMSTKLKDGMVIEVKRAFEVRINVDGKTLNVLTANNKVSDILEEYNIELGEKDKTKPSFEEEVLAKDVIDVIRVKEEVAREAVDIPYRTVITYNDEIETGEIKKSREGENGKKEVEYRIVYENDIEVIREIINEDIIKEPIDELIEKGSEKYLVASRGQLVRYKKVYIMESTAYDLSVGSTGKTPDHPEYGITFSGTKARPGVVAVDPKVIPLGSKLYVEALDGSKNYGFASAEDTGSAIKGMKIDLFIEDSKAAWRYGRRKVKVYILD